MSIGYEIRKRLNLLKMSRRKVVKTLTKQVKEKVIKLSDARRAVTSIDNERKQRKADKNKGKGDNK